MFTATRLQVATYLLGVCPFSIAFLVFLNSSVSFIITDLIGQTDRVGDAVGTLGFADELLAIVACPLWGLLSDRIGLRFVSVAGYLIIGLALVVFVQTSNVYPQLLFARLLFSIGGAAASTMVTAILPAVAGPPTSLGSTIPPSRGNTEEANNRNSFSPSIASELTITPARFASFSSGQERQGKATAKQPESNIARSTSRIAGYVGMFTGAGALIALMVFLPLPAKFQYSGYDQKAALKASFYIVAAVALILASWCFIGLRGLQKEQEQSRGHLIQYKELSLASKTISALREMWANFQIAVMTGFKHSEIGIGYVGGFVARASSVGISLFIPLLVNAMFLASNLCDEDQNEGDPSGLPDLKRRCPRAYVVAAELTGATETVALIFAPIFGYWSARTSRKHLPLLFASVCGMVGYPLFAYEFDPDGSHTGKRVLVFFAASLIGISQIGAIVCSLGTLSKGILEEGADKGKDDTIANGSGEEEAEPLLETEDGPPRKDLRLSALKGSFAGVYSLYGGLAILILTKLGGILFDKVSPTAPFWIMSCFNTILLLSCMGLTLWKYNT
ncbi:hypothetical protein B0A52_01762 [Exophiala mesophila]|uniref:Major facilitator superfamily (MFS) profile domain-containing protein n=1 Tax=Exophiala mesophila TaxID=212818 RepID=A0A438NFZ8_EXOME|nr:hypothetical protein B0A52_01762 [Exophiala mesophila]